MESHARAEYVVFLARRQVTRPEHRDTTLTVENRPLRSKPPSKVNERYRDFATGCMGLRRITFDENWCGEMGQPVVQGFVAIA